MRPPIYRGLTDYIFKHRIRFTTPAHKGIIKMKPESLTRLDVSARAGTDDLNNPRGFVLDGENQIAGIFGSHKSFYLTNGPDSGVYATLSSICKAGDKVIVDPECDKAVINAITILALIPIFMKRKQSSKYGILGGIDTEELDYLVERYRDAKLMIIASPTYHGVCANIKKAVEIAHTNKMLLMVDESLGAHFNFGKDFPETAVECGADIVVQSLSKTLGGFNGSGLLHISEKSMPEKIVRQQLAIYQGGSNSFAHVCSTENAILYAFKNSKKYLPLLRETERGRHIINHTTEILWFGTEYNNEAGIDETDPLKIVLNFSKLDISAKDAAKILETKYGIEPDSVDRDNIIFAVSLYNTPSEVRKLVDACAAIGKTANSKISLSEDVLKINKRKTVKVLPYKAFSCEGESVHYMDAEGRLLRKSLFVLPRGAAIAVSGEKLTKNHIDIIGEYIKNGADIDGIDDLHHIEVLSLSDSFGI